MKQKSKCAWVKQGDDNTAVLHASLRKRTTMNRIISIKDTKGTECNTTETIQNNFFVYYETLLGSNNEVVRVTHRVFEVRNYLSALYCETLTK